MDASKGRSRAIDNRKWELLHEKYKWFEAREMDHSEEEFMEAVAKFHACCAGHNLQGLIEALKVIVKDVWCVDHDCVWSLFSSTTFPFTVVYAVMDSGDDEALSYGLLCLCRMMVVSEDLQEHFCEQFKFNDFVKLTSHEDRNVSLQSLRLVRVLLDFVLRSGMNFKLERLLNNLKLCARESAEHDEECAYILQTLATYVPVRELLPEEAYTQPDHPSLLMEVIHDISVARLDYVEFSVLECVLRTTTALLSHDPSCYPVLRHWYLPELYEVVRESDGLAELSLKRALMEMMDVAIDKLPPADAQNMIQYLPIDVYFNGALDWTHEAAKGCIHILSYLVLLGDVNCIALLKEKNAVQRFSESYLHNGPFFTWAVFFEFCYAMNSIHDPDIAELVLWSDFDARFMDALELDAPDVVGYALLSLWELLNVTGEKSQEVMESFASQDGIHEALSSLVERMQGVTFTPIHIDNPEVVPISEVAARILAILEQKDDA